MDQVAALHWIQENIAEFGGLPSNVTIVGHGHGAACAHLLILSPMAKGLFARVVLMSGSALSPWAIARDPAHYARQLGDQLNCTNLETMIDCLRTRKVSELINVQLNVPDHLTAFGPIIDSIVVPLDPRHIYNSALYRHHQARNLSQSPFGQQSPIDRAYDLMLGGTDVDSACIYSDEEARFGVNPQRRDRILRTLVRNLYDYHQQAILLTLFNEYADWSGPKSRSLEALESVVAILSDSLVIAPLVQTADLHSSIRSISSPNLYRKRRMVNELPLPELLYSHNMPSGKGKTFFYLFDTNEANQISIYSESRYSYESQSSVPSSTKRMVCAVDHDLAYMFGDPIAHIHLGASSHVGPFYYSVNLTRNHVLISEMFMQYLVNFARSGDPNIRSAHFSNRHTSAVKSSSSLRYFWPQYDSEQKSYLSLGSINPKALDHHNNHRLSLWLNLIPRLLMDDREFYLANMDTNLSSEVQAKILSSTGDSKVNSLFGYGFLGGQRNAYRDIANNGLLNRPSSAVETSRHIGGTMASEPYSQQRQQQLYRQHHLLLDYENPKTFDGVVRTVVANLSDNATEQLLTQIKANSSLFKVDNGSSILPLTNEGAVMSTTNTNNDTVVRNLTHELMNITSFADSSGSMISNNQQHQQRTQSNSLFLTSGDYSNALLITIGIGCALLLFNVVIFAGLYYQLDKNRKLVAAQQQTSNSEAKGDQTIKSIQLNSTMGKETIIDPTNVPLKSTPSKFNNDPMSAQLTDLPTNEDLMIVGVQSNSLSRTKNRTTNFAPYTVYPANDMINSQISGHQQVNFDLTRNEHYNGCEIGTIRRKSGNTDRKTVRYEYELDMANCYNAAGQNSSGYIGSEDSNNVMLVKNGDGNEHWTNNEAGESVQQSNKSMNNSTPSSSYVPFMPNQTFYCLVPNQSNINSNQINSPFPAQSTEKGENNSGTMNTSTGQSYREMSV